MSQVAAVPPNGYEAYRVLTLCSNRLENVQFPILINDGLAPLLIGKGNEPKIWLSSVVLHGDQRAFFQVVIDNAARSPQVRVESDSKTTTVFHDRTVVCRVEAIRPDEAAVTKLDLRPAGLNIYGDEGGLHIGNSVHSGNRITNGRVFVSIG